jgi:putative glycosyltransferase
MRPRNNTSPLILVERSSRNAPERPREQQAPAEMDLSIVTTLYGTGPHVVEFYERAKAAAEATTPDHEIIFVNDGSPDDSLGEVLAIAKNDPAVVLIDLTRNFGHHAAILAGLTHARGRRIFLIDSDLEEQPEWLSDFSDRMDESGADVVYGVQESRQGGPFRRLSGFLFYKLFNALSTTKIPVNPCTVRLMDRAYVKALLDLPERNVFLAGSFAWLGFDQLAVPVHKQRSKSSRYGVVRTVSLFLNALTSFTSYPLHVAFALGSLISAAAGLYGSFLIINKLVAPESVVSGFAALMVSIWFLGGLIILLIGLIGIYVSRVFVEVKERPVFVVRSVWKDGTWND